MARKTVNILDMIEEVNRRNETSTCTAEVRQGWNSLLESMLMQSNVYNGFGYLRAQDLKDGAKGQAPGIIFDKAGGTDHQFPDETRRMYYLSSKLTK